MQMLFFLECETERGRVREGIMNGDMSVTHNSFGSESKGFPSLFMLFSKYTLIHIPVLRHEKVCTHTINQPESAAVCYYSTSSSAQPAAG